jgi:REP element-mobilizing transposase RayT
MHRRCFNHDYRAPFFYMLTLVTEPRRPLFGSCSENRTHLSDAGRVVEKLWRRISVDYPQIAATTLCVMPDHVHGILRVKEPLPFHVGVPIRAFKAQVTATLRKTSGDSALQVWENGYNDKVVWRDGSLAAYTRYIQDNPRRYCLKKAHPDLFSRIEGVELPMSGQHGTGTWSGYGNRFLLDRPEKRAIRVSRSATAAEIAALKAEVLAEAASGTVIVSPFISPGEKAIALAILDASAGDVITLKAEPFPPLYKPSGKYFDLCCEGRLLVLSSGIREEKLSRETCLFLNRCAEELAKPLAINGEHSTCSA